MPGPYDRTSAAPQRNHQSAEGRVEAGVQSSRPGATSPNPLPTLSALLSSTLLYSALHCSRLPPISLACPNGLGVNVVWWLFWGSFWFGLVVFGSTWFGLISFGSTWFGSSPDPANSKLEISQFWFNLVWPSQFWFNLVWL